MYKDTNSSSGSGASTKGGEVELVSRFLAPLCARDEAARNIALAAARNTVEGWLGGVGSPNQWEDSTEIGNTTDESGKFKAQDGRYDMSIERSPLKEVPKLSDHRRAVLLHPNHHAMQDAFRIEGFFPESVTETPIPFSRDSCLDAGEKFSCGSLDCVDGKLGNEPSGLVAPNERWPRPPATKPETTVEKLAHSISSDEGKGFNSEDKSFRFKDNNLSEPRFGSSSESERKFFGYGSLSNYMFEDTYTEESRQRIGKITGKIKGTRQKQLEDDDLDSDTKIYGKSPKFDESHGNFGPYETSKNANYLSRSEQYAGKNDRDAERYDRKYFNVRGRRFYEHSDETSFDDDQPLTIPRNCDGVVFNTLQGFENDYMIAVCDNTEPDDDDQRLENMNLENSGQDIHENFYFDGNFGNAVGQNSNSCILETSVNDVGRSRGQLADTSQEQYLRNNDERKFTAGQIKRPLSQDEDVSAKSGRVLEGPEVTPGDVGRMLNLGNALDGPRQAQANKYLSLVTLHLPVILRLSVNCPFHNVRIKCAEILLMVKDRGLPVPEPAFDGPSAFVPTTECATAKFVCSTKKYKVPLDSGLLVFCTVHATITARTEKWALGG